MESSLLEKNITLNFTYTFTLKIDNNTQLRHLKNLLNKETIMDEYEYELYIADMQLLVINQELNAKNILDNFHTNEFSIRSNKSILSLN